MSWFSSIFQFLPMVPGVVAGIEAIHGSAVSGATKKQLALQALGLAYNVSQAALPAPYAATAADAADLAGHAIDFAVTHFNRHGWPAATPLPAASPVAPTPSSVSAMSAPAVSNAPQVVASGIADALPAVIKLPPAPAGEDPALTKVLAAQTAAHAATCQTCGQTLAQNDHTATNHSFNPA